MKNIPKFANEVEEAEFWNNNDSIEYLDWSKAKTISFSELKPTTKSISIRLPEHLIQRLKQEANKIDVPYQSLIKIILTDSLKKYSEVRPLD